MAQKSTLALPKDCPNKALLNALYNATSIALILGLFLGLLHLLWAAQWLIASFDVLMTAVETQPLSATQGVVVKVVAGCFVAAMVCVYGQALWCYGSLYRVYYAGAACVAHGRKDRLMTRDNCAAMYGILSAYRKRAAPWSFMLIGLGLLVLWLVSMWSNQAWMLQFGLSDSDYRAAVQQFATDSLWLFASAGLVLYWGEVLARDAHKAVTELGDNEWQTMCETVADTAT